MNLTLLFIGMTVVAWIAFDFYIINKKGKYESISAHIIRSSKLFPMIPFLVGFLCGHLWWKMSDEDVYNVKCTEYKAEK